MDAWQGDASTTLDFTTQATIFVHRQAATAINLEKMVAVLPHAMPDYINIGINVGFFLRLCSADEA
jgi:hypothetical protein